MKMSEELESAVGSGEVQIRIGHCVVVMTHDGHRVGEGSVESISDDGKYVRVRDKSAGSDLQIDVDPSLYELWVLDSEDGPARRFPALWQQGMQVFFGHGYQK